MPVTYKNLARANPAATTLTNLYSCPAGTNTVISTIVICNRSATATTFRLTHAINGNPDAPEHYFAYDTPIAGNSTVFFTFGACLQSPDILRIYAGAATLTFIAWGEERT